MIKENPEPAYVDPRPNGDYLVERILNSRRRKGSLQYQMLWEGFPLEMASWEPIRLIDGDISTLVENFYKEFPGKPGDPAKGHNEYLDQLEEEKKAEAEKNTHGDADPEAELTVEATLRPMAKKTKTADADTEVESDAEACAGANTAVIAEDDEDDIPVSAVGDRGPKSRKAKKTRLFDANRPVNVGDAAAQAMKLIPASPRNKKKAAAAIPATRKSSRNATQKYGSLDDKALTQGKVKPSPNGLSSYSTSNDDDDEEIRVPRPAYPAGLVSMASLIADPGVTAGRSVQTAADLFSNASDDEQEVEVSQNPFRNNRGTKRAHDGKEKSANKKPRDDSDSSDYDLTTCPVAANSPVQVRKKAKMTSTRERKAQEITAGKKVARSHMDDLFGEALEVRPSLIPKPDIPNVPDGVVPVDKEYLVVVARNQLYLMCQNMRNEAENKANDEARRDPTADPSLRSLRKSKVQHCSLSFFVWSSLSLCEPGHPPTYRRPSSDLP